MDQRLETTVTVRSQASVQVRILLPVGEAALVAIMFQSACSTQFVAYERLLVATAVAPRGVRERCAVHGEVPVSLCASPSCVMLSSPLRLPAVCLRRTRLISYSLACLSMRARVAVDRRTNRERCFD